MVKEDGPPGVLPAHEHADRVVRSEGLGDLEERPVASEVKYAANREAYEEYSRHYCLGDGGHAGTRSRT